MPNAKRVRQDKEAAEKRYARYAEVVTSYNAQVDQVNSANKAATDLYNQQAADYNAFVEQVKAGTNKGVGKTADGQWALVGSHDGALAYDVRDKGGNPMDKGAMYGSFDEGVASAQVNPWQPLSSQFWAKNADGTATRYAFQPDTLEYDALSGQAPTGSWQAVTGAYRSMEFDTPQPTQQTVTAATPEEPKGWNPSVRELSELRSPTVDAAGGELAGARGEVANRGVIGEVAARSQQLANPDEEPLTNTGKGILARVMGGDI